jgi:hypothetical protein
LNTLGFRFLSILPPSLIAKTKSMPSDNGAFQNIKKGESSLTMLGPDPDNSIPFFLLERSGRLDETIDEIAGTRFFWVHTQVR